MSERGPDWRAGAWRAARRRLNAPITAGAKQAFATLFVVTLALAGMNLLFTAHYVHAQQAAQQRQGQAAQQKICATLHGLAALRPPAGNPVTNPSRGYLQGLHAKFAELGQDVGCR